MSSTENVSRRDFLSIAGIAAAATAGVGLAGCASQNDEGSTATEEAAPEWMPEKWDYETDVVVVGYGGAGISAAITMCKENLGEVIVVEAAPAESEGGNTRVSGNIVFIPDDPDSAVEYQTAANEQYEVEEDLLRAWAEAICENKEWLEDFGVEMKQIPTSNPEFPELPAAEHAHVYCVEGEFGNQSLWNLLKEQEEVYGYEVMHDSRATRLVRNPLTNEALGVIVDQNGTEVYLKARKGVILSCGGYENNPDLLKTYYDAGTYKLSFHGTPYNRGDGFALVEPFGAQLWHMNSYSGPTLNPLTPGEWEGNLSTGLAYGTKDYIYVGRDGSRFIYEEVVGQNHHGKLRIHGVWTNVPSPQPVHVIFGSKLFEQTPQLFPHAHKMIYSLNMGLIPEKTNQEWVDEGVIIKADTVEELAEKTGKDPEVLAKTIADYNAYCAAGLDPDFHRGEPYYEYGSPNMGGDKDVEITGARTEKQEIIPAFDLEPLEAPYYAVELYPCLINTQGGPKRNVNGELVDADGNAIPRLYGAGEFGDVYGYLYNGGGNVSEAVASGRLAARHAGTLTAWDAEE